MAKALKKHKSQKQVTRDYIRSAINHEFVKRAQKEGRTPGSMPASSSNAPPPQGAEEEQVPLPRGKPPEKRIPFPEARLPSPEGGTDTESLQKPRPSPMEEEKLD